MKGSIYTTQDFVPKNDWYYILNFKKIFRPVILPVYFVNKVAAKRALKQNIKRLKDRKKYTIIKGNKLKKMDLNYQLNMGALKLSTKYEITPDMTPQQRKNVRTTQRRRLRRMGLLSLPKGKKTLKSKVTHVRAKVNTQKVATSPNTAAKAFHIERKGKKWLYIVLNSGLSLKNGRLYRIECIQVNLSKGASYKEKVIHTMSNDILQPLLITQVLELIKDKQHGKDLETTLHTGYKII